MTFGGSRFNEVVRASWKRSSSLESSTKVWVGSLGGLMATAGGPFGSTFGVDPPFCSVSAMSGLRVTAGDGLVVTLGDGLAVTLGGCLAVSPGDGDGLVATSGDGLVVTLGDGLVVTLGGCLAVSPGDGDGLVATSGDGLVVTVDDAGSTKNPNGSAETASALTSFAAGLLGTGCKNGRYNKIVSKNAVQRKNAAAVMGTIGGSTSTFDYFS